MTLQLPAKLRVGEVQRFAVRATQLEKYRPIVTYWCQYYILQYLLNRNLHVSDDECQAFALQLMDKLERYKFENSTNDAIVDDVAAKAYIENFAMDTFARADEAQRSNKVTKQTADTFIAAATFLDLLSIWGELGKEVAAKSKFAKFHAARILKAFKAGEDPNATNPVVEEPPVPEESELDAEMKGLEQQNNGVGDHGEFRSPMPGEADGTLATSVEQELSHATPSSQHILQRPHEHEVSPIDPPDTAASDAAMPRQHSIGGGYFPTAATQQHTESDMPVSQSVPLTSPQAPLESSQSPVHPQDFYQANVQTPVVPSPGAVGVASPGVPLPPPISTQQPPVPPAHSKIHPPLPVPNPVSAPPLQAAYRTDDDATAAAQKHARWAISALNFEDVNTAVKELRLALESLGAT